ncbi:MAG: ETRAMP family protein [Armatimonadota bacterium]
MTKTIEEPVITADDLHEKWEHIEVAVKEKAQQKVMGLSYIAIGGIVLGAAALGTAFYLGRKSAQSGQKMQPPKPGESFVGMEEPQLRRVTGQSNRKLNHLMDPVVDTALRSAVNALTDKLTYKPSCEARL